MLCCVECKKPRASVHKQHTTQAQRNTTESTQTEATHHWQHRHAAPHLDLCDAAACCCGRVRRRHIHAATHKQAVGGSVDQQRCSPLAAPQQRQRSPELEARQVLNPQVDRECSGSSDDACGRAGWGGGGRARSDSASECMQAGGAQHTAGGWPLCTRGVHTRCAPHRLLGLMLLRTQPQRPAPHRPAWRTQRKAEGPLDAALCDVVEVGA